jgi:NDP-sugar pyrophosphorylase family protein
MPIGNRSILEVLLGRLYAAGIREVTLCVGYLAHLIRAVVDGNPERSRLPRMTYVHEGEPLGTAGPLKLVPNLSSTFLAMNGDVLTKLDFSDLVRYHRQSGNVMTIATHRRVVKIDYGVLHVREDGVGTSDVYAFEEKPELPMVVSAGIYVMEPEVLDYIPEGEYFDFPDLVHTLLEAGKRIGAYEYDGFWLDIGRHEDYEQAVALWEREEEQEARRGRLDRDLQTAVTGKRRRARRSSLPRTA